MLALRFSDIRLTTSRLFSGEDFDSFLVTEVSLSTLCSFTIDGHIPPDYFSGEELGEMPDARFISWGKLRPFVYQLIRGNRLPGSFRIVFRLSEPNVAKFLRQTGLPFQPDEVGGLFLNIRYQNAELTAYTGTSLNVFRLNRDLDHEWERMVQSFLRQKKIPFEEQ